MTLSQRGHLETALESPHATFPPLLSDPGTPDSLSHPAIHFKRLLESHSRRVFPDQPHRFLAETVEEGLLITDSCSISPTFFPHSGPGASQSLFSGICEWLSPATGVSLRHLPYFSPSVYIPHLLQNPAWRSPLGNLGLAHTTVTDWTCPRFWFPVPLSPLKTGSIRGGPSFPRRGHFYSPRPGGSHGSLNFSSA